MSPRRRSSRSRARGAPRSRPEASAPAAPQGEPALPGWLGAAAVVALALVVRLAVGAQLADEPLFQSPQLDSLEFLTWARQIATGSFPWPVPPPHGLGYPAFLGALLSLFGGSLGAVRVVQAFLGAGTCLLTALVGSCVFGRRAGIAAGIVLALQGPLIYTEVSLLAEGLLLFLLTGALVVFYRVGPPLARGAGAGFLVGLAALVRPTALVLLPVLAGGLLLQRRNDRRAAAGAAGLLLAACLLVVGPVVWKISRVNGAFVPIQGYGGLNFYIGNSPAGEGLPASRLGRGWERLETEALRAGHRSPAEQDRYYLQKTREEIAARPLAFLGLLARKALWLTQAEEVRDTHSYAFFQSRSWLLRLLPGFGLLLALAAAGVVAAVRRGTPRPVLLAALIFFAATAVLLVVGSRYRLPLVPLLAVYAGLGAVSLFDAARARRIRELAVLGLVALAFWSLAHVRHHELTHNFAEEWAMTGASLEKGEDWTGALGAYQKSLAAGPGYVTALEGIGRTRIKQSDFRDAEAVLRQALQIDPDAQRAHLYLGVVLQQTGRPEDAVRELRASHALSPDDLETLQALAPLLLARGEIEEAAGLYARLAEKTPNDAAVQLALARLAGARNRPAEGLPAARRAVELAPDNPEAWLVLARLAIDARDAATAEPALQRVDALIGHSHPQVAEAWEMLARLKAGG
ncbi:MAG TPA: tetratricopeptide repeat protein [Thermoanaerobaculia bacterium]|nr:tetratricopeptide repeat protein [Thermoanaerobaculia bacterium]